MRNLLKENSDAIDALARAIQMTGPKAEAVHATINALVDLLDTKPQLKPALIKALTDGDFEGLKTALVNAGKEQVKQAQTAPAAPTAPAPIAEGKRRVAAFVSYLFED